MGDSICCGTGERERKHMNHRRFAKARDQQSRGRAYSQNSSGAYALRRASRRTRARESGCLPTPRIEAAHKVIVHEQLADEHKGQGGQRDTPRARLRPIATSKCVDMGLSHDCWFSPPPDVFICVAYRTDCDAHPPYPCFIPAPEIAHWAGSEI